MDSYWVRVVAVLVTDMRLTSDTLLPSSCNNKPLTVRNGDYLCISALPTIVAKELDNYTLHRVSPASGMCEST